MQEVINANLIILYFFIFIYVKIEMFLNEILENKMIRVIINADDFGKDENVNDAIRLCFEKGYITNTTLMVNMPEAVSAVRIAGEYAFEDRVGLHFNLTQGQPVSAPIRSCKRFCDGGGRFNAQFHLKTATRLFLSNEEMQAVCQEATAQLDRYLALGLKQKHLDSHHHVHTDISVWAAIEPVVLQKGFKSVRLSRNIFEEGKTTLFNTLYKKYYNGRLADKKFEVTKYFGSFADFRTAFDSLEDDSVVEVMVHPLLSPDGELLDTDYPMEEVYDFVNSRHLLLQSY